MTIDYKDRREQSSWTISRVFSSTCLAALLGLPAVGMAGADSDEPGGSPGPELSVDEIALMLSSPVSELRTIALDIEHTTFQGDLPGANEQQARSNIFTLTWPIKLNNGNKLLLRATIPHHKDQPGWKPVYYLDWADFIIRQVPNLDGTVGGFGSGHDHIGSVGLDISYGDVSDDGFISMFGIANVAPTSEDQSARRGQWLIGPEISLGQVTSWGLFGLRAKHLTNIAGEGEQEVDFDTNETTLKLFFSYGLGNGWLIESNPVILYDWEAVSGNEWTVPVGAGVSKTMMLGRVPMKLGFELQKYVVSPDRFGPDWLFKLSFTPVISSKGLR